MDIFQLGIQWSGTFTNPGNGLGFKIGDNITKAYAAFPMLAPNSFSTIHTLQIYKANNPNVPDKTLYVYSDSSSQIIKIYVLHYNL